MARSTPASTSKSKKSSNNARTGYAKRHSKTPKIKADDVYEYAPDSRNLGRRAKVGLDLDRDEDINGDVPEDEEERTRLRARLIGENEDDEMIDSADDEDIESDDAFDDSDEDRFAGFFSSKKKPSKGKAKAKQTSNVRFADVDLNEDEDEDMPEAGPSARSSDADEDEDDEEEESGEDDEFIDVLDILDGHGEPLNEDADKPQKPAPPIPRPTSESDEEEEYDDDDEMEEEDPFVPSDDDDDASPDALDNLQSFVSSLSTASLKRKPEMDEEVQLPRKRRILKEKEEIGAENEYRPHTTGAKLALDDLLAPLTNQAQSLQSLKTSTKPLASSKVKTLSAPLQYRAQERLDREAAYEQTKAEVDKWSATMKRIQEADHLSFPLQAKPEGRVSALELAAKFEPRTKLESSVDKLLKSAKLRDEDIQETEEGMLKMNKLTVVEVAERRAELRRNRELMFRADVKAKRVAKIKSKTYRKIKRREREKVDEEEKIGSDEEAILKRETERARERATLRHKNTGKWAKQMKGRNEFEEEGSRHHIEEMLTKGERLRRRIAGKGSDDESEESDADDDMDDDAIRKDAFEELSKLKEGGSELEASTKDEGVFEMKFMKDAMARKQNEADKVADDFLKELSGMQSLENEDDVDASSGAVVSRTGGRAVFRPGAATQVSSTKTNMTKTTKTSEPLPDPTEAANPWLNTSASSSSRVIKKQNEVVVGKDSHLSDKAKNKLKKKKAKTQQEQAKTQDDAVVEIDIDNVLNLSAAKLHRKGNGDGENGNEDEDEVEIQEHKLELKKGKGKGKNVSFEQRDLVAMAFAGDNVVQEFQETKRRETEADAPTEVDTTLPGWGSWGGSGTPAPKPKPNLIKKIAGVDPTSRKDYGKGHVIISEKVDKKAAKYLVKDLPYPYTSRAQYERSLEQPIGVEWNTRVGFQRATMPKVTKKMGAIIDPLNKVF